MKFPNDYVIDYLILVIFVELRHQYTSQELSYYSDFHQDIISRMRNDMYIDFRVEINWPCNLPKGTHIQFIHNCLLLHVVTMYAISKSIIVLQDCECCKI